MEHSSTNDDLTAAPSSPGDRTLCAIDGVADAPLDELVALVCNMWGNGWMPGDLLATMRRAQPERVVRSLAALILLEHDRAGYGDRVSLRWYQQLDEARELVGERREAHLTRLLGHPLDNFAVWFALTSLPPIAELGPRPGQGVAGAAAHGPEAGRSSGDAPDAGALRKVRALLAKAESTEFAAEAEAFTEKAQSLITEYSLGDALRSASAGDDPHGPFAIRFGLESPYEQEKYWLLGHIARANRCRTVWDPYVGLVTVFGYPIDLEATELLFASLLVQATRAVHAADDERPSGISTRVFRRSFLEGFAFRIGNRLRDEVDRATAEAEARESGGALVPVLASRSDRIDAAVATMFPNLGRGRASRAQTDRSGFSSGYRAADRADLGARRPLRR